MDKKEALRIFEETGALQNGHFLLSSGLHSPQYFQCALVLQYPDYLQKFAADIIDYFYEEENIGAVISPAIGGIVISTEVGRQLGARSIFAEREEGKMVLRRDFVIEENEKVLICEDVITTGGSVQEVFELVEKVGGYPIGVAAVMDRSGGKVKFDVPFYPTVQIRALTYKPDKCPLCNQGIPLTQPGSRVKS